MAVMAGVSPVRTLIFLVFSVQLINSHNVPVFIWGSNGHSPLASMSALSHVNKIQFGKSYMKHILVHTSSEEIPLIVFIQDRLSMEDLTTGTHGIGMTPQAENFVYLRNNMEKNPSLTLQSVEDPLQVIKNVNAHQTIQTTNYKDDIHQLLSELGSHLNIVNLPPTVGGDNRPEALKANDELMSKAVSHLGPKGYIAIFTGREPSWDAASEEASHRRIARGLLQAPSDNATTFALYMESVTVKLVSSSGDVNVTNATLTTKPDITSKFENDSSLMMNWNFPNPSVFDSFSMDIQFTRGPTYWAGTNIKANLAMPGYSGSIKLKANYDITAGKEFSFSCSNTILKGQSNYTLYVTLHNFQVEPFSTSANVSGKGFSESFHCSTFFTLPIWMGFFTVLLFTIILGIGIFMLFEVKTTDRFDDPKGKTITVPQSE